MSDRGPSLHPGVAAVIFDDRRRILLHRRKVGDGWAPPSGRMESGETVLEALKRELMEETNLAVEVRRLIGLYSDPEFQTVIYPDGRRIQFVTSLFACRVAGGTLRDSDEGTSWKWFEVDSLPSELLPYAIVWLRDAVEDRGPPVVR